MKLIAAVLGVSLSFYALADQYMVMQYNETARIVLSRAECTKATYRAAAQRVDGAYLRGCWAKAGDGKIKIQWEGGDSSEFDENRFYPIEE